MSMTRAKLELPQTLVKPVEPPPDVQRLRRQAASLPEQSVVEPPVDPNALKLKAGQITLAQVNPGIEVPALPMPQQRANAPIPSPDTSQDVPPPPSTTGLSGGRQASGQLVALSLHPTPPQGDIQVPNGSKSGVFAAGPTGTADAPGTPDFPKPNGDAVTGGKGDGRAASPGGTGKTGDGLGASGVPNGLSIIGGSTPPKSGAVVAATPSRPNVDAPSRELAANRPPADIVRPTPPLNPEKKIEEQVFGPRKYYSMQIQMANFTSAASSWVIRFAEMDNVKEGGDLETPDAIKKVDPAYPPDLIRDQIGGTVALYAVIHADGSVGEVRVLRGFNERLDENAKKALMKWQFRPARKNGTPVEMQAVVYIPFNPPARRSF
jgi:TonB family protein